MWKMIIGQAIFQLVVTLVLYFAGPEILKYDRRDEGKMLELDTVIFNTFVWMQIFNEFNNRRLDNRFNIFEGIHRNMFFIVINCIMVGLQIAIIFVGSRAFSINPGGLDGTQWAISIVIALFSLPWGVLIRLFPDAWFAVIAETVGVPFMVVYKALAGAWIKLAQMIKRKKPVQDDEEWGASPAVIVSNIPKVEITETEKKEM
jgi:Ca2+-transporting ATPase